MTRKLLVCKAPPQPISEMTPEERRAWARQLAEKMCGAWRAEKAASN